MLRLALILPALALLALGALSLYNADRNSQTDFVVAGLELVAGIALIGLAFVVGRRSTPEPEPPPDSGSDRAEVLERLHRHTEAFRLADEDGSSPVSGADAGLQEVRDSRASEDPERPESRNASRGEAGVANPEPTAVRLPSILLLNLTEAASVADVESAPPLGTRDDVLARVREIVPDFEIDAAGRSEHTGPDHSVRLDLGAGDLVHTIVIDAAGRTGISVVRWIIESTGWRAFVPRSGRFVEADLLDSVTIRERD